MIELNGTKIPLPLAYETDPDRYFPVACRLCGETWSFPRAYESTFKENPSWECPQYKRGLRLWGRNAQNTPSLMTNH